MNQIKTNQEGENMNINGLTTQEIKRLGEYLIKANDNQIRGLILAVKKEAEKRGI